METQNNILEELGNKLRKGFLTFFGVVLFLTGVMTFSSDKLIGLFFMVLPFVMKWSLNNGN